jgi:hypothetical protein
MKSVILSDLNFEAKCAIFFYKSEESVFILKDPYEFYRNLSFYVKGSYFILTTLRFDFGNIFSLIF